MDGPQTMYSPGPFQPFLLTEGDIKTLSYNQVNLLYEIFKWLQTKVEMRVINNHWAKEKGDNSCVTATLRLIYKIVTERMPANAKNIGRYNDLILEEKIKAFIDDIETVTEAINALKNNLRTPESVLSTTRPHHKKYSEEMEKDRKNYFDIIAGDYKSILDKENTLSDEINERIKSYVVKNTSFASFKLIVDAHDVEKRDYLEKNIADYKERTEKFRTRLQDLKNKIDEMKAASKNFEDSFCLLKYTMKHNCLVGDAKMAFNFWRKFGYNKMEKSLGTQAPAEIAEPKKSISATPVLIWQALTEPQTSYVVNICNTLLLKEGILTGRELFPPMPSCDDPFFTPLLKVTHAWVPLNNRIKFKEDKRLKKSLDDLSKLVCGTSDTFNNYQTAFQLQIDALVPNPPPHLMKAIKISNDLNNISEEPNNKKITAEKGLALEIKDPENKDSNGKKEEGQNQAPNVENLTDRVSSLTIEDPKVEGSNGKKEEGQNQAPNVENLTDHVSSLTIKNQENKGSNVIQEGYTSTSALFTFDDEESKGIKDLRQKYMDMYADMSIKELNTISQEKKKLQGEVEARTSNVKTDSVTETSLKIICNAHDIKFDELKKNLFDYQECTREFKAYFEQIGNQIDEMNIRIEAFKKAFNYFSYLYKYKRSNTVVNKLLFEGSYKFGYSDDIQEGNFPPSEAAEADEPPNGIYITEPTNDEQSK